jgi:hypothetical protein
MIMTGAQAREKQRRAVEMDEMSVTNGTKLRIARGLFKLSQGPSQWTSAAREFGGISSKLDDWEGKVSEMHCKSGATPVNRHCRIACVRADRYLLQVTWHCTLP